MLRKIMLNSNITWHDHSITKTDRAKIKDQKPSILWFTGLSGSGKSTIANALEGRLYELGRDTYLLDGDNIRMGLNSDLGFSDSDRVENIRRIGEVCRLFVDAGLMVLSAFISPFREDRAMVRSLVDSEEFIEIYIDTPLDICESRDPKGLYQKARSGDIAHFTGISSPYEVPQRAEITIDTHMSIDEAVAYIIDYLKDGGYITL